MRVRRVALAAVVALAAGSLLVAGSATGDPGDDQQRLRNRIDQLQGELNAARGREQVLTSDLTAIIERTRSAQGAVDEGQSRLSVLEGELARQRARLGALDTKIAEQTLALRRLGADHRVAVQRLENRVRELYMAGTPDLISFIADSSSLGDVLDDIELLGRIGTEDERIVRVVEDAQVRVDRARRATRKVRAEARLVEREVAARTDEQRSVTRNLVARRDELVAARVERENALASILHSEQHLEEEVAGLERDSAALAEKIRVAQAEAAQRAAAERAAAERAAAQAAAQAPADPADPAPVSVAPPDPTPPAPAPPPSSGGRLSWPVSGPVVSGFGPRGSEFHQGVDIIAPSGTPVHASADGVVVHASWLGGYGNLVVVDHGGGLSTAYAHNTSYAAGVGQPVSRGQVIAYVGSTGNSSGPHVHFEVRVNGTAVDPLGYL
jgi:murein DD-endopeptidase MepM/ murein hydrolase activator NlpD